MDKIKSNTFATTGVTPLLGAKESPFFIQQPLLIAGILITA